MIGSVNLLAYPALVRFGYVLTGNRTHISWTRLFSSREQLFADPPDSVGYEDERIGATAHVAAHPQAACTMRAFLVLRFYEDLSEVETARVLGCSVGTVKSQTFRGLDARAEASGEPTVEDGAQHGLTILAGFGLLEAHLCAGAVESQDS